MSPQYTYLMNDGTTGSYKETKSYGGTKEAVGIVINQDKQLAIALNPALGFIQWAITTDQYDQEQVSKNTKTTVVEALAIESGYDETWNANTSIDNTTVKATSEKLPAFKAVGDYVPTKSSGYAINISGSLVGKKWHMPSMDEWKYVFETLGFGDVSELTKTVYPTPKWYGMLVHNAFARFGNNRFTDIGISCYTCTEYNDKGKTSDAFDVHPKYADMEFGWTYKAYGGRVYPFIYY